MTADENSKVSPIEEGMANGEVIETVQVTSPKATELETSPSSFEEAKPPVLPKDEFTPAPLTRSKPALPRKSSKRSPPQLPRRRASSLNSEGSVEERLRSIDETKINPTAVNSVLPEGANPSVISTTGDLPILQELTNNNSSNSIASGNTLSVPETNARKSLDNMSRTSFSQEFISQLSQLECGTDPILERNRLSVNTIRLISKFLKRKAFLEEEHAKQVSKTVQQTLKEMEKEEVYEGAFTIGFRQILEYHDKLARNRLKFALDTNHIADELNNISKDKERTRKALKEQQIRDHKRLVDAEIGLEKSYNRYVNTSDAWDQSVVLKHNGGRLSPDGGGHSTILNHVPKQVATTFGLFNKPKSLDQLIKQEEECKARAMISKDQYSIQLFHLNSVKKEYYQKLLPALIRDSLDNINQCDYWAQFYLSTYSHNYQTLLQQEVSLMGSSPEGLDGAIAKIQPIEDTQIFLNSLLTKYKAVNMEPIQMQEYQHSSAAQTALSSRAIFGVDLRGQLARDRVKVPIIITKCAEFIEKIGIDFEGIYRVSGASTKIQKLKSLFDHDASKVDLEKIDYAYDISNVAGVLKLYLRELPEPLIPVSILEQFMPLMPIEGDDPPQLQKFQTLLVQLPIYSYETIKYLILHLTKVMAHSDVNKMTASNLAIVFGPTLFSPPSQDNSDAVSNMTSQCQATLIMIKYSDKLFERSPTLPERSIPVPDHLGRLKYQSFDEQNTSGLKISPTEFVINKDGVEERVQSPDEEISEIPLVISGPVLPNTLNNDSERISLDLPSTSNNEQLVDSNQQLKKEDNINEPPHD